MFRLPSLPGTYVLLLKLSHPLNVAVQGRVYMLEPSIYVYVGSALGPGGLRARVLRHFLKGKSVRWHIDQSTEEVSPLLVAYAVSQLKLECRVVREILREGFYVPARGFGSSDCNCPAHLLACPYVLPHCLRSALRAMLRAGLEPKIYISSTLQIPLNPSLKALASDSLPTMEP